MESLQYVSMAIGLAVLALCIYAAVKASSYDDSKWQQVGQNKMVFIIGCVVGGLCCGIVGLVFSLWFLLGVKPKLDAIN